MNSATAFVPAALQEVLHGYQEVVVLWMGMVHLVLLVHLARLDCLDRLAAILEKAKVIVLLMNETAMVLPDIGRLKKSAISGLI
jgi:hypothetical protein